MEALKHGMLMQIELSAISAQLKHFQGLSYIYYGCNSPVPWCFLLTSFWCCSVLDLKCSPVEPIFVSAAASKGYFLLIVLNVCMEVLKYNILWLPGDLFNDTSTRSICSMTPLEHENLEGCGSWLFVLELYFCTQLPVFILSLNDLCLSWRQSFLLVKIHLQ